MLVVVSEWAAVCASRNRHQVDKSSATDAVQNFVQDLVLPEVGEPVPTAPSVSTAPKPGPSHSKVPATTSTLSLDLPDDLGTISLDLDGEKLLSVCPDHKPLRAVEHIDPRCTCEKSTRANKAGLKFEIQCAGEARRLHHCLVTGSKAVAERQVRNVCTHGTGCAPGG